MLDEIYGQRETQEVQSGANPQNLLGSEAIDLMLNSRALPEKIDHKQETALIRPEAAQAGAPGLDPIIAKV